MPYRKSPGPGAQQRRDELLRLIKGSPQPELSLESAARRIGVELDEIRAELASLEEEGKVIRQDDRLIVVEPAASRAPDDEPIP